METAPRPYEAGMSLARRCHLTLENQVQCHEALERAAPHLWRDPASADRADELLRVISKDIVTTVDSWWRSSEVPTSREAAK